MLQLSILIPYQCARQRDTGHIFAAETLRLAETVSQLGLSFEIIIVDDHSPLADIEALQTRLLRLENWKLLRLDRGVGLSGVLTAGIAAARGQQIVALGAGDGYPIEQLPELLAHLARVDLVVGRPERTGIAKACHRLARIPRWLLLGLEVRDPECLFWAARREALRGLELARGMYRYLASHVAMRGYRVGELLISPPARRLWMLDGLPNPGDLLVTWWMMRRWRHFSAEEIFSGDAGQIVKLPESQAASDEMRIRIPRKRRSA